MTFKIYALLIKCPSVFKHMHVTHKAKVRTLMYIYVGV